MHKVILIWRYARGKIYFKTYLNKSSNMHDAIKLRADNMQHTHLIYVDLYVRVRVRAYMFEQFIILYLHFAFILFGGELVGKLYNAKRRIRLILGNLYARECFLRACFIC